MFISIVAGWHRHGIYVLFRWDEEVMLGQIGGGADVIAPHGAGVLLGA